VAVLRNFYVPALPSLGDRCRELHKVLVQVDGRPVQAQGFGQPDSAEERDGEKRDKLRIVLLGHGKDRCNFGGSKDAFF